MRRSSKRIRSTQLWRRTAAGAMVSLTLALSQTATAGEGGTTHVIPGSMSTLIDNAPTAPGMIIKPMYLNYSGSATKEIPTAAGLASNLEATANTFVLAGIYAFEGKVFGATYSMVAALPYSFLDVSASVQSRSGVTRRVDSSVSGFGDLTFIPTMLAWKEPDSHWQYNFVLPIYAPTGSYQEGRLGNPGLNYWTFDPVFGVTYSNTKSGFNALLNTGYAINTENPDTDYKSGSVLHFDGAIEQILPLGTGLMTLGAEGFYFQQVSCDSGSGAVLGCFKGRTAGLGPVIGYIQPLSKTESFVVEFKWLFEMDTKNRLDGDYIWLKAVYKF